MTEKKPKPDLVDDERTLWIGAAVAAVVFALALIVSVHALLALVLGLLLFGVLGWILHVNLGFDLPRTGARGPGAGAAAVPPAPHPAAAQPAPAAPDPAASNAAPAAPAGTAPQSPPAARTGPPVQASTPLPGEADLAGRKGAWRYEAAAGGDADDGAAPVAAAPDVAGRPQGLEAPRAGGKDDLKRIKGVGPKLEQTLNDLGYYHFDQIAGWTGAEVAWVDENLEGFRGRVTRDDWVGQARQLTAGG
ncbi:endonuclease [Rhodobacteraceae bacterium 2CG4]|uniref:Endonuclease n=1 Tax=Halovulum marinum TaxID=2662447 RepID=A0A6L5YY46_9RHOB|nr:endonuclease [Halovulum marinum]MSU88919.1 endonuclease [Halovulum marinum]